MYNSGNSSKNVTGSAIVDGTVEAADLATAVNNDIADGVAGKATADLALPKAGGTMTGTIAGFTSTGIDDNATSAKLVITDSLTTLSGGLKCDATSGATATFKSANSKPFIVFEDSSGTAEFYIGDSASVGSGSGFYDFYTPISLGYRFYTNGTERMRISSGGLVSIGTTTTYGARLTVDNSNQYDGIVINSTTTAADFNIFKNAGTTIGRIDNQGSSVAYLTTSDYRLKENVTPMTGSIDRLKNLNPSRFNFIANADTTVDGFLAHEAQAVVPECVSGDKDGMTAMGNITDAEGVIVEENIKEPVELQEGHTWIATGEEAIYQGIDQSKLVPLLVSALQEAIARIETLENA
jgi:hypothetical protein